MQETVRFILILFFKTNPDAWSSARVLSCFLYDFSLRKGFFKRRAVLVALQFEFDPFSAVEHKVFISLEQGFTGILFLGVGLDKHFLGVLLGLNEKVFGIVIIFKFDGFNGVGDGVEQTLVHIPVVAHSKSPLSVYLFG